MKKMIVVSDELTKEEDLLLDYLIDGAIESLQKKEDPKIEIHDKLDLPINTLI